jgi:hypothetical protein
VQGAVGAPGATGPTGATGAQGTNGPTSNQFNFDTAVHASNYTVPDTDTFIYYLLNNPSGSPANLNLPHASVKGRILYAIPANTSPAGVNKVTVTAQGTDSIFTGSNPAAQTNFSSQRPISLFSDGTGHWHVISTQ